MTKKTKVVEGEVIRRKRKTKYEPWMCDKIIEIASQGGHVSAQCQAIGINSPDTFYRWLREYPEFKEAYEEGKLASKAFYEEVLLAGALGKIKNFNFNALAMTMNNKFPDEYKRNATGSNTEINIGSINSIESMDSSELDKKIAQLQKKLNLIPNEDVDGSDEATG